MLEAEIRTESLDDVMDLVEDLIRSLTRSLEKSSIAKEIFADNRGEQPHQGENNVSRLHRLQRRWQGLQDGPWPRITYQEAKSILKTAAVNQKVNFDHEPLQSLGLQLEHERFIASEIGKGSPVFVTNYPREVKPFYMLPSNFGDDADGDDRSTVACFDLLFPDACEVVGGSLREHRFAQLSQSMHQQGLSRSSQSETSTESHNPPLSPSGEPGNLDWYLDLRRYGSVPHGGFGLGFDRLLGYLAGVDNIRDVAPWPRYYGRCDC